MGAAAEDCLAAAAAELDPLKQAALLKASCYGRAFKALEPGAGSSGGGNIGGGGSGGTQSGGGSGKGPGDRRRLTVDVARRLRVLNALRDPSEALEAVRLCCDRMGCACSPPSLGRGPRAAHT